MWQITRTLTIQKKNQRPEFHKFHDFLTSRAVRARLRDKRISKRVLKRQTIIFLSQMEAWITLFTIFYDLSLSRHLLSKPKNRENCEIRPFDFLNFGSTCDLTDVPASINDRKTDARPFDTIYDILRCLSLLQSLFKDRNEPI